MNESFEDENICTEFIKNCAPEGWISSSLFGDYYFDDPRHANRGQHFIGLMYSTGRKVNHKFIRSRLLCSLRPGSYYRLEFFIRSVHPGLDSLGVYFSPDDILFRDLPIVNVKPQLWLRDGITGFIQGEWMKVSLHYQATGKENFICFGDFRKTAHQFPQKPDLGTNFYFFIDDVSLHPENNSEFTCDDADKIRDEEYAFDARHKVLDRYIYTYRKSPPPVSKSSVTIVQKIDTLVIPDVLFAINSYMLNEKAHLVLDSFINSRMNLQADSLVVEGHTDSTGSVSLNEQLSANRALTVGKYLQPHFKTIIRTRGWASLRPVADNQTSQGRQKNRRVEIFLYTRE